MNGTIIDRNRKSAVRKLHKILSWVHTNKALSEHSLARSSMCCLQLLLHYPWQGCRATTETDLPQSWAWLASFLTKCICCLPIWFHISVQAYESVSASSLGQNSQQALPSVYYLLLKVGVVSVLFNKWGNRFRFQGLCHPLQAELRLSLMWLTHPSQCPSTTVFLLVTEELGLFRREITTVPMLYKYWDHLQINLDGNIIFFLYRAQFWLLSCPQSASFHTNSYYEKLRYIPPSPK